MGIRVHNQKPQEKIEIKPMSPIPSSTNCVEESDLPSLKGKGVHCAFCGYVSALMKKCQYCKQKLHEPLKLVDVAPTHMSLPSSQPPAAQPLAAAAAPVNKEQFYGNSYSRKSRVVRPARNKYEEPQCVTLSSSEDEADLPATSGTREEPAAKTGAEAPEPEQPDERVHDLMRWKEAGFKGSFFTVTCRDDKDSIRMLHPFCCPDLTVSELMLCLETYPKK